MLGRFDLMPLRLHLVLLPPEFVLVEKLCLILDSCPFKYTYSALTVGH